MMGGWELGRRGHRCRAEIEFLFTGNERYSGLHGDLTRMTASTIQQLESRIKATDPSKAAPGTLRLDLAKRLLLECKNGICTRPFPRCGSCARQNIG